MKLQLTVVFYLFLFFFSLRETNSQDFMTPTVNIVTELQKIKTMEEKINKLQKQNEDLLKVVETLRSSTAKTDSRIDGLLPKIQASADKVMITSIQSELSNIKSRLTAVEKASADTGRITTIQSELNNMKSRVTAVENASADKSAITSVQSEIQSLKSRLAIVEKVSDFNFFKKVGKKYFVANGQTGKFDDALNFCRAHGAVPVLPLNHAENLALTALHGLLNAEYIFLGTTDREIEGKFVDMNKKPLAYTKWRQNEPNDYKAREDCVGIRRDSEWNDLPCGNSYHIACEF